MTTRSRRQPVPVKAPEVRNSQYSEIVPIADWLAYKAANSVRLVSGSFGPNDKYVHIIVEPVEPKPDTEQPHA